MSMESCLSWLFLDAQSTVGVWNIEHPLHEVELTRSDSLHWSWHLGRSNRVTGPVYVAELMIQWLFKDHMQKDSLASQNSKWWKDRMMVREVIYSCSDLETLGDTLGDDSLSDLLSDLESFDESFESAIEFDGWGVGQWI